MRLNRGTIALLVLSLVVIIAISIFSNQPPAAATPTPTVAGTSTGPVFASIDTSTVNRFEVRDLNSGQGTVMTRDAALVWSVTEAITPGTTAVDQARINTQLGNFTTLNATDRFTATNLADFGLDAPDYTISITRLDGTINTVRVGNTNPGASRYYVMVDNQPDVILVQQASIAGMTSMITNPPYIPLPTATPGTVTPDTRRPLLTGITSDQITSLVIRDNATGASTTLTKDASLTWAITATNSTTRQPDQFATFTAAANFAGLQYVSSFGPNDLPVFRLEDFGLDTPAYTIIATTSTGTQITLTVGGVNPASTEYYVLMSTVQIALPTATPAATAETTAEATSEATAAVVEATAEATAEVTAEATAEATVAVTPTSAVTPTPTPVVVYLIQRETIDGLVALIATPPYLPEATATPEATTEATAGVDATAETTAAAEATTEMTAEATAEATTAP
ncbi:MAG: DUF4340 domain-containing protein [Anaerolineae bacterium]